ncbi:MAG: esterase family protein [Gemmatales bacterium]|nr:esterase family protein [Gemmatales bacterium]MDW8386094.1 alpha/beta hydrolase-fold protein [Gemmatales bacterium]
MQGCWKAAEVAGHPVEIYEPPRINPGKALIYLHPARPELLHGREAFTRMFDELDLLCVCPHGGPSWWADKLCPDFDDRFTAEGWIVEHVAPWLQEQLGTGSRRAELVRVPVPRLGLLGVSVGGQAALRMAFKHPRLFPAVAALAPTIELHQFHGCGTVLDTLYESREQCRQDAAPMHIRPDEYPSHIFFAVDPEDATWYRGVDRLREKLTALGISHACDLTTRAGGHRWEYFEHMAERAIRFLDEGLATTTRRLL